MEFQPAKQLKMQQLFRARYFYGSIVLWMFFLLVSYGNQAFRNSALHVLWSHISNSTTSHRRQDGQSSPFTTNSSQKVHGMRNCRASVVAETEKPPLMEHHRLYPLLFAL